MLHLLFMNNWIGPSLVVVIKQGVLNETARSSLDLSPIEGNLFFTGHCNIRESYYSIFENLTVMVKHGYTEGPLGWSVQHM